MKEGEWMPFSSIQLHSKVDMTPVKNPIHFRIGDIFIGKISKIYSNQTAIVKVGDQNIVAKLEVPLVAGERYWFQVLAKEGEIQLKMISSSSKEKTAPFNLFNQLSLPNNKVYSELLTFLAKEQIPLTKETIMKVGQWIEQHSNHNEGLAPIKVMAEKALPFTEGIYKSLYEAFKPQKATHVMLRELENYLQYEPKTGTVQSLLNAIQTLAKNDIQSINILQSLLQIASNEKSENHGLAINILDKMGILSLINSTEKGPLKQNITLTDGNKQPVKPEVLHELLKIDSKEINETIKRANEAIQEIIKNGGSQFSIKEIALVKQLDSDVFSPEIPKNALIFFKYITKKMGVFYEGNILSNKVDGETLDQDIKPLLVKYLQETEHSSQTKEVAEQLLNKMNGQQLLSNTNSPVQFLAYQLPLQLFGFQTEMTMQWSSKRLKDGKIDPNFCHILFYLELEHLKETIVDMKVQNRIISIKVFNSNDFLEEMSKSFLPKLKEGLKELNYTLSSLVFVQSNHEVQQIQSPLSYSVNQQYLGVDIRI